MAGHGGFVARAGGRSTPASSTSIVDRREGPSQSPALVLSCAGIPTRPKPRPIRGLSRLPLGMQRTTANRRSRVRRRRDSRFTRSRSGVAAGPILAGSQRRESAPVLRWRSSHPRGLKPRPRRMRDDAAPSGLSDRRNTNVTFAGRELPTNRSPRARLPVARESRPVTGVGVKEGTLYKARDRWRNLHCGRRPASRCRRRDSCTRAGGRPHALAGRTCSQVTGPSGLARSLPAVTTDPKARAVQITQHRP